MKKTTKDLTSLGLSRRGIYRASLIGLLASAGLSLPHVASAQNLNLPSANERTPEEYRPEPILYNSFEISPSIGTDIEYIDNVFSSDVNKVNDTVLSIRPSVLIRDRRDDRQISVRLLTGFESYLDGTVSDRITLDLAGNARFGIGTLTRTFVGANFRENDTQGRGFSDTGSVGQPLSLSNYGGNFGVERDIGPYTALIEGRYRTTEFDGDIIINGQQFESSFRDFETLTGRGRLSYSVNPAQRIYAEVIYNDRDFSEPGANSNLPINLLRDRSSDDISFLAGYTRQLTNVLQLDINAGYITQSFDDPTFLDQSSLTFNGAILWDPTRLTSVQFRGSRSVDTTNDPFSAGLLRTEVGARLSHELRRNLIFDLGASYADLATADNTNNGSQISAFGGTRYLISKKWSLRLRAEHFDQDIGFFSGSQSRLTFGARYNF